MQGMRKLFAFMTTKSPEEEVSPTQAPVVEIQQSVERLSLSDRDVSHSELEKADNDKTDSIPNGACYINDLPVELLLLIFSHLPQEPSLFAFDLPLTCRLWNQLCQDDIFWKAIWKTSCSFELDSAAYLAYKTSAKEPNEKDKPQQWACPNCTLINWSRTSCELCETPYSAAASEVIKTEEKNNNTEADKNDNNKNSEPDIGYKRKLRRYYLDVDKNWHDGKYNIAKVLTGHAGYIRCVRFNADHRAVSSSTDMTVRYWDLLKGTCIREMRGHASEIDCVSFSENICLSGGFDGQIRYWNLDTGECLRTLQVPTRTIWCVHLFPRSKNALIPGPSGTLALWDYEKGEFNEKYLEETSNIMCLYCEGDSVPNGILLTASGSTLRSLDTTTGRPILHFTGHKDSIWSVHYQDGLVASASSDRTVKLWDYRTGQCVSSLLGHDGTVFCMWYQGNYITSGSAEDMMIVWDVRKREKMHSFKEHSGGLRSIQHDSYKIVSASWDRSIKVWSFL
jgi:WD40 repeat protein